MCTCSAESNLPFFWSIKHGVFLTIEISTFFFLLWEIKVRTHKNTRCPYSKQKPGLLTDFFFFKWGKSSQETQSQEELNLLQNFSYTQRHAALLASIQESALRSFRRGLEAGLAVPGRLLGKFVVLWPLCLFCAQLLSYLEMVSEVGS